MVNYKGMKKGVLLALICLCLFLFCGCSTTEVLVKQNSDGSVDLYTAINLSLDEMVSENYITSEDVSKIKTEIETQARRIVNDLKLEYRNNITKWYQKDVLTAKEYDNLFKELTIYNGWTDNVYVVKFNFKSSKAYQVFLNFNEGVKVLEYSEKGLFATKSAQKSLNIFGVRKTVFDGKNAFNYINDLINEYLTANFSEDVAKKFPKFTLTYCYLTSNGRLHSDADEIISTTSGNLHCWEINETNSERLIEFYVNSANRIVWYIEALTVAFIFIAVYLIVIYFKKDKKE